MMHTPGLRPVQAFRSMAEAATQRAHALSWALAQLCAAALTSTALRRGSAARQAIASATLAGHRYRTYVRSSNA